MSLQWMLILIMLKTVTFAQYYTVADCECERPDAPLIYNSCKVDNNSTKSSGRILECECKECPVTVHAECQCSGRQNWHFSRLNECDVCYACGYEVPENASINIESHNSGYVNETRFANCISNCQPVRLICELEDKDRGGVWNYYGSDNCPGFMEPWSKTWTYTRTSDRLEFYGHPETKQISFACPGTHNLVPFNPRPATCYHAGGITGEIPKCEIRSGSCKSRQQVSCDIGRCILKTQVCDGVKDCADGSDERRCAMNYKTSTVWDTDTDESSDFTPTETNMHNVTETFIPREEHGISILVVILLAVLVGVATLALIICGIWNWHLRRKFFSITPANVTESIPMNPGYLELTNQVTNQQTEDTGYLEPITRDLSDVVHVEIPIHAGDPGSPYADVLNLENNQVVNEYEYIRHDGRKL